MGDLKSYRCDSKPQIDGQDGKRRDKLFATVSVCRGIDAYSDDGGGDPGG